MSRSNPTANSSPNPAHRWFEWKSSEKAFRYYDKEKEEVVFVKLPFQFIVLDRTSTVRGWNKKSGGIYSNELRDTRSERFVVKFFSGGTIATGFWQDIKEQVAAKSGKFCTNVYIAYKDGKELKLGCVQMSGASLGAWFSFEKLHRKDLFEKAVVVKKFEEEENGGIEFNVPVFEVTDVTPATNKAAIALDTELQAYLAEYFKRNLNERPAHPAEAPQADAPEDDAPSSSRRREPDPEPAEPSDNDVPADDDIPF